MDPNLKKGIEDKAQELNSHFSNHDLTEIKKIAADLNSHVEGKIKYSQSNLLKVVQRLTCFTILLPYHLSSPNEFLRGRKFNSQKKGSKFPSLSDVNYLKDKSKVNAGRFNLKKQPMYYGCLNIPNMASSIIFSELQVKPGDNINCLRSSMPTSESMNLMVIGLFDHFRRYGNLPFRKQTDEYIKYIKHFRGKLSPIALTAINFVDSLLVDFSTRQNFNNSLYDVTCAISQDLLSSSRVDGILYPSVQFKGLPNVCIKPDAIEKKLQHLDVISYHCIESIGYGLYKIGENGKATIGPNGALNWI